MPTFTPQVEQLANGIAICLGDCREVLAELQSESVDCILTDPPYGNSNHDGDWNARLNEHRGLVNKPIANDSADGMRNIVNAMLTHAARLLVKEASACCCFCGGGGPKPGFAWLAERMDRDGLQFFHSIIWDKLNPGLGWRFRRQHEMIMVGHRAGGRLLWADDSRAVPNIYQMIPSRQRAHPNEKPLPLIEHLLLCLTKPGQLVVDPFMGSGTTGVAAARHGRRFFGVELCPVYYGIARRRISEELSAPQMFVEAQPMAKQESLI